MRARWILLLVMIPALSWAAEEPAKPLYAEVTTVQELMTAVAAVPDILGGTIVLRPGVYELQTSIVFVKKHSVVLKGSGWNTTVRVTTAIDAIRFEESHFCVVEDMLIDQSGEKLDAGSGVVFTSTSSSNEVRRCRIQRFAVSGVRFEGDEKSPMSSNAVRESHFIGNKQAQLWSSYNNDFYFIGNQFGTHSGPVESGAVLRHSSAGTYSMNYHWDNLTAFSMSEGSHFNRIENNRFEESRRNGILIGGPDTKEGCMHTIILGNTIHTNSKLDPGAYSAVLAYNASDVIFSGNDIFSWDANSTQHKHALELHGCGGWVITGNILRNHTAEAILLDKSERIQVRDNLGDEAGE